MGRGCQEFLPLLHLPWRSPRATLLVLPGFPRPTSRTSWAGNVDTAGGHRQFAKGINLAWGQYCGAAVAVKSERVLVGWLRLELGSVPG